MPFTITTTTTPGPLLRRSHRKDITYTDIRENLPANDENFIYAVARKLIIQMPSAYKRCMSVNN
jgi:hypothetical protein